MERDQKETIEHFSHEHPLVLNEEQSYDQSKKACCNGCLEPLFGPCFSCGECDQFHLHKKCAQAPLQITNSPFHRKHPTLTLKSSINVGCDFCKESRDMFSYWCSFDVCACLDIKCAFLLHNIDGDFRELKYVGHQHPLTFIENLNDELIKTAICFWCQKPLTNSVYACLDCEFFLHKKCAQLPIQLHHPSHRKHPLYIEDDLFLCKICREKHYSLFYRCLPCKFDIDIECVVSTQSYVVGDKSHHEHQFTRSLRNLDSFLCEACGTEGAYISYICSLCDIMVHKKCISVPRFIKIIRHRHNMVHNYFFQKREIENHYCGICFSEVKAEYGSYCCLKEDCNYVVHVNCVTENKKLYSEIHPENQKELEDENSEIEEESSITCVMKRNECGDAVKIKHFSHEEHCLMLGNKINGDDADDEKRCDGCMEFIIKDSFYHCLECDFILHKSCAALPREKHLWFGQALTSLDLGDMFQCRKCHRPSSGLFYKEASGFQCCLRCARIFHSLTYEGHEHPLFFDFDFQGKCNACGAGCWDGAFKCKDCTYFALDYACITLPQATRHKCDPHFLKLTFHDQSKNEEQDICDICEEQRDPNSWFYHCAVCDKSTHLKCALGNYPFFKPKIGTTFRLGFCPRHWLSLIFVKTFDETCNECGGPCQDVALRCKDPECNYITHYDH